MKAAERVRSESRWRGALAVIGLLIGVLLVANEIPFGFLFIAGAAWQGYMSAKMRTMLLQRELATDSD